MSSYVTSLDPVAKDRYNEKLKLLDLSETEEPYELWKTDKFVDDMTLWPAVEYGHIFCYFVDRPGTFTKTQLMQCEAHHSRASFVPTADRPGKPTS